MDTLQNKIIAEFMGLIRHEPDKTFNLPQYYYPDTDLRKKGKFVGYPDQLEYHTSWDWLMPVIDKIESIGHISIIEQLYYGEHRVYFIDKSDNSEKTSGARAETKIEAVWLAVISFIQWFNQNKIQNGKMDFTS